MKTVHSVSTPLIKTIYPSHSTQVAWEPFLGKTRLKKNKQEEKNYLQVEG